MSALTYPIRSHLAILLASMAALFLRLLGRGATSFPGSLARRIDPHLLGRLCAGKPLCLITGSNGKTSSSHILGSILEEAGFVLIRNASGANMEDGILSTVLAERHALKKEKLLLVFEVDEAWFPKLCQTLAPSQALILNLCEDQIDRHGGIMAVRERLAKGLAQARQMGLVFCADEPYSSSLAVGHEGPVHFFGLDEALGQASDQKGPTPCPRCQKSLHYSVTFLGHYGHYHCPSCGLARPEPRLRIHAYACEAEGSQMTLGYEETRQQLYLPLPGLHNLYNAMGAALTALQLGARMSDVHAGIAALRPIFGRMERLELAGGRQLSLILVKNTLGLEVALQHLQQLEGPLTLFFLVNAEESDGRDLTWVEKADLEGLLARPTIRRLYASGQGVDVIAERLKEAAPEQDLTAQAAIGPLLDQALEELEAGGHLVCLPNYTAMLAVRERLFQRGIVRDRWEA